MALGLRPKPASGFILPAVLVAILTLAVIVAAVIGAARRSHESYSGSKAQIEARLRLESALAVVEAGLLTSPDIWVPRKEPFVIELEGNRYQVFLQASAGLVDLNASSQYDLERLFLLSGASQSNAQQMAARAADWRDKDDLVLLNGGEREDYVSRGVQRPRNGPFQSIEELALVLGITERQSECLAPVLTIDSGIATPVGPYTPAALRGLVLDKSQGPVPALSPGSAVEIEVNQVGSPSHQYLTAVIRLTNAAGRPFLVHSRRWTKRDDRAKMPICFS